MSRTSNRQLLDILAELFSFPEKRFLPSDKRLNAPSVGREKMHFGTNSPYHFLDLLVSLIIIQAVIALNTAIPAQRSITLWNPLIYASLIARLIASRNWLFTSLGIAMPANFPCCISICWCIWGGSLSIAEVVMRESESYHSDQRGRTGKVSTWLDNCTHRPMSTAKICRGCCRFHRKRRQVAAPNASVEKVERELQNSPT